MPVNIDLVAASTPRNGVPFKPSIEVKIDSHFSSKVYTSGAPISGVAIVKPTRDTPFDFFEIVFTGIASTRLDFIQQYPSHNFRSFMKLRMPISPSSIPADRVFRAGETYTFPFNFVVPHQLTLGSCNHGANHPTAQAREQHLRLPPTVGHWEGDDQAPEMAQVEYAIKARAIRRAEEDGVPSQVKLMEGNHMVKVLPELPEDAPLDITRQDERYTMSKAKTMRKNLFGKTGKLRATATQPGAVMLSADAFSASPSAVRINLEFTPASSESCPPRIGNLTGKLQAVTFFAAVAQDKLPNLGSRANTGATPCLSYSTTNALFSVPAGDVNWKQERTRSARRDSGYSSSHVDEDEDSDEGSPIPRRGSLVRMGGEKKRAPPYTYVASVTVPFTIPIMPRKVLLPSFHSCLISRTYTLHVTLSAGPTNTALAMAVPLQVGVVGGAPAQEEALPSFESAIAASEEESADAHLRPRMMSIPDIQWRETSVLPGYEEHRTARRRTVQVASEEEWGREGEVRASQRPIVSLVSHLGVGGYLDISEQADLVFSFGIRVDSILGHFIMSVELVIFYFNSTGI